MSVKKPRKQSYPHLFPYLTTFLILLGCSLLLYPNAAQWVSQYNQVKITERYEKTVKFTEPAANIQIQNAEAYNQLLASGADIEKNTNVPLAEESFKAPDLFKEVLPYEQQLYIDGHGLMSRIRIPKIDVDLPVYHGTSEETLLKGAGHLRGTSLPVGGESTRTVITAHRGLAGARMFTDLDRIQKGDEFSIESFGRIVTYRVIDSVVVEADDRETVRAVVGKDLATLVTCTPLGINSHRILVTGERIIPTPVSAVKDLRAPTQLPHFPWWLVIWTISALPVTGYTLYLIIAPWRKRRKYQPRHALEK